MEKKFYNANDCQFIHILNCISGYGLPGTKRLKAVQAKSIFVANKKASSPPAKKPGNKPDNKLFIGIAALAVLLLAITFFGISGKRDLSKLTPSEVVREYYESFGRQDYAAMYELLSDGFKKIEPTAKDFQTFKNYLSRYYQTADGVSVLGVREASNDGETAVVEYEVELFVKTGSRKVKSEFILKKKDNGWKLIHPYGLNSEAEP